jgi:predicted DNA-binding transcriptional regulator AlpA
MRRDKEPKPPLMISRRELARLLGVTERHVQNLDRRGVFRPLRLGASVRYVRAEVEETISRLADEGGK